MSELSQQHDESAPEPFSRVVVQDGQPLARGSRLEGSIVFRLRTTASNGGVVEGGARLLIDTPSDSPEDRLVPTNRLAFEKSRQWDRHTECHTALKAQDDRSRP